MPVQMIELEEVQMVETTDESLEAVVGGIFVIKMSVPIPYPTCIPF